jgi:hypothetical protein
MPQKDKQKLEKKFKIIKDTMEGEEQVIKYLVDHKVLDNNFEVDTLSSQEKIGELVRHLPYLGDVLPQFIEALRATHLPPNLELAQILCEDITENQVSNL